MSAISIYINDKAYVGTKNLTKIIKSVLNSFLIEASNNFIEKNVPLYLACLKTLQRNIISLQEREIAI